MEERIKLQEQQLNPQKYKSQQTFLDEIKQASITGQVVQSRKDIQKDTEHLTTQGYVQSYDKNNGQ